MFFSLTLICVNELHPKKQSFSKHLIFSGICIENKEAMVSGAIKFLETHIDDDITLALLESVKDGDNSKFVELKNRIESDIYAKFLANEFIDNYEDFEDLAD